MGGTCGTVPPMPRTGYDSISIDRAARSNLSELKLQLSAQVGRQLSTSDAIGLLVVVGWVVLDSARGKPAGAPVDQWVQTASDVWQEQKSNARRNRA